MASKARSTRAESNASNASVDDVADEVADLEVDGEEGEGAGASAASRKNAKRRAAKKKKAAAAAAEATPADEDADAGSADAAEAAEEEHDVPDPDDSDAPPVPTSPAPSEDAEDSMLTESGQTMRMHREPWGLWSMSDYAAIKVRGVNYLEDGIKIRPPCPPTMEIVHLEIYQCDTQIFHVCSYKDNWLQKHKREAAKASGAAGKKKKGGAGAAGASSSAAAASVDPDAPLPDLSSGEGLRPFDPDFFFVVNYHVQSNPSYHLTMYFQRREVAHAAAAEGIVEEHDAEEAADAQQAFDRLFARFIEGDTAFRNKRLKLLPFLVEGGNWFVSKAVGNRPVIIGSRITTTYHCSAAQNYMEVDIDCASSNIGSGILRVVKGYAAYLTIDLTMLIEGQEDDELPEVILGGCRLRKLDLSKPELRQRPTLLA